MKKIKSLATMVAIALGLLVALPVFAQTTPANPPQKTAWGGMQGRAGMMRPAVFGTVTAVNGTTLTISGRVPATTFTVDASSAKVMKDKASSTVSNIAVGDTVAIQGTVSGTNVTATSINDGKMMGRMRGQGGPKPTMPAGDGQPVIAGKVTAVNGTTLTIVNNNGNSTYTVTAPSAQVTNVKVGDTAIVQGAVNGTSVNATSVIDHPAPTTAAKPQGFFGNIGSFFGHLFGF